jgi:DNA-binding MarR family transcriptional regulator
MDMPTLNGVLKWLALRDLVLVEISQQDKRRRAIFLTASGSKLAAYGSSRQAGKAKNEN